MKRLHGKILPRLSGLPGLADRATRLGGSPNLSCKRDQIKMRDYMDRRVTPPKRVTSPTWGPLLHLHVNRPSEGRENSCKCGEGHYLLLWRHSLITHDKHYIIMAWTFFYFRDKILQTFNGSFVRYVHHCNGRYRYGVGRAGVNLVRVTDHIDLLINDSQLRKQ